MRSLALLACVGVCACSCSRHPEGPEKVGGPVPSATPRAPEEREKPDMQEEDGWREVLHDPCTGDWRERWFLDGEVAQVANGPDGMTFSAGPEHGNDAHHAVLWTKRSFSGDIKIEFDYTRLDDAVWCVNIIYVLATGSGEGPHSKDIHAWRDLRRTPSMRTYFNNMDLLHISFAAYGAKKSDKTTVEDDYVRARRYLPLKEKGLRGTELEPDYKKTGFFRTGVPHSITVIKRGRELSMGVRNDSAERTFVWRTDSKPDVTEGRVGLRHMYTRSARYSDIRISTR